MLDLETVTDLNRELMALRRAQLILESGTTASVADKRRITDRVMELIEMYGLLPDSEQEDTTGSPMF